MKYRLRGRSLVKPLEELDQRRSLFNNLPIDPTHAEWLRQRTWIRTIHGTTRIEGNTLSDLEVEALLEGEGTTRISDREAREIIGTRDALALAASSRRTRSSRTKRSSVSSTDAFSGTRARS